MWIRIQSFSFFAHHGVYEVERALGNQFEADVEVRVPETFGNRDDLSSTLDYTRITDLIARISEGTTYNLLERLCADICSAVFDLDEAISEVIVRVRKLVPPLRGQVRCVEIERRMLR